MSQTSTTNTQVGLDLSQDGPVASVRKVDSMHVLSTASQQWAKRPSDQRYTSLAELRAAVARRRELSTEHVRLLESAEVVCDENGGMSLQDTQKAGIEAKLNHWTFGQLSTRAGTPTAWLRQLGMNGAGELAALNLNTGLSLCPADDIKVLSASGEVHAITSPNYGRIWDIDVVDSVMRGITDEWKIPSASYATRDPKRASTLYASDRDVFLFLVNDSNAIEVPGEAGHNMFRGFYVWNSETGNGTFGIATFLYDYVCDNRNIWGVREFRELRVRHTAGAPLRFEREASPMLAKYLESSTAGTIEVIKRSQRLELGKAVADVKAALKNRGFTKGQVQGAIDYAETVPGNPRSLWNLQQGLTAVARDIEHTDARIAFEEKAGEMMAMADAA